MYNVSLARRVMNIKLVSKLFFFLFIYPKKLLAVDRRGGDASWYWSLALAARSLAIAAALE